MSESAIDALSEAASSTAYTEDSQGNAAARADIVVIAPRRGLALPDLRELYAYRDLFRFLIWRNIKVRYAQSAIGIGWAVIQPLFSMIVFYGSIRQAGGHRVGRRALCCVQFCSVGAVDVLREFSDRRCQQLG